ncbi:hypothetical protein [Sorangium sp. So ce1182]|uniref:hypothetical protein n=1 Tax=Sorangium sp. So ce1182 TaxID=3133334 RepID=UPI003F639E64
MGPTFTPPSDGALVLTLSSETDLGMYVRTSCMTRAPRSRVWTRSATAARRSSTFVVDGGVPLFIFVDTYFSTDAGPYALNLAFTPAR